MHEIFIGAGRFKIRVTLLYLRLLVCNSVLYKYEFLLNFFLHISSLFSYSPLTSVYKFIVPVVIIVFPYSHVFPLVSGKLVLLGICVAPSHFILWFLYSYFLRPSVLEQFRFAWFRIVGPLGRNLLTISKHLQMLVPLWPNSYRLRMWEMLYYAVRSKKRQYRISRGINKLSDNDVRSTELRMLPSGKK